MDKNCEGASGVFFTGSDNSEATYESADLTSAGITPGKASSVMIPYGLTVTFHSEDNMEGDTAVVAGGQFLDANLAMDCLNLKNYSFDNKANSLGIERSGSPGMAVGQWAYVKDSTDDVWSFTVVSNYTQVNDYAYSYD